MQIGYTVVVITGIFFETDCISCFFYRSITAIITHLFLHLLFEKQAAGMFYRQAGSQHNQQKDDIDDFLKH